MCSSLGGIFAVYDVMRLKDGALTFPLPWASDESMSFVATPDDYRSAATAAGFSVIVERPRGAFAIEFFATMRARHGRRTGGRQEVAARRRA